MLQQELEHARRLLVREKSLTIAAVLSLMLGIGANTAIFQSIGRSRHGGGGQPLDPSIALRDE